MKTRVVYLLHFDRPLGNPGNRTGQADHYIGSAIDGHARISQELADGGGVKILQACIAQGIGWQVARLWPGDRTEERRRKNRGGASRFCPMCGVIPHCYMRGDGVMIGGYAAVAGKLNEVYVPQPPVTRGQVYAWHRRQTRNYAGQEPPRPVQTLDTPARTTSRVLFDLGQWVDWFGEGTRGPHRKGWVKWAPADTKRSTLVLPSL